MMRASVASAMLYAILPFCLAIAVLPGCSDDSTAPEQYDPELTVWLGSYSETGGGDSGAFMIDIIMTGSKVTAEILVRSSEEDYPDNHMYLKGSSDGNDIVLHLDTDRIPYTYEFDVQLTIGPGGTMTGTFDFPPFELTADFSCTELEWTDATVDTFISINVDLAGLAFDGEHLWISTYFEDHLLMDSTVAIVDTVAVLLEGYLHWTSDALTSDEDILWGGMPMSVSSGGTVTLETNIVEFEKNGDIIRVFRFPHRLTGLAWSPEGLWAMSSKSDSLYRMDLEGTVQEILTVGVPDLCDIEFDGTHFWALGWYMKRVYKISRDGDVLMVYFLPDEYRIVVPGGLAFDGSNYWCGFVSSYSNSLVYRLNME